MSSSSYLPLEIVVGILSRLPVKSLLQFRCVSTSWLRLIDSSDFINLHLNHSVENNTGLSLILTDRYQSLLSVDAYSHRLLAVEFDSLVNNDNTVPIVHPELTDGPWLRGSCNGLVLLSCGFMSASLVLWNPSTRKFRELPPRPSQLTLGDLALGLMTTVHGFGYDRVNDDYKLVSIIQSSNEYAQVEVYSFKSNSWDKVENPVDFSRLSVHNGKLAGGAVHWVGYAQHKIHHIVAFDLMAEEFRSVPQPEYSHKDFPLSVESFNGCLSMVCIDIASEDVCIWVMKDYGIKESWTKLVSLAHALPTEAAASLRLLAYSNDCTKILVHDKYNANQCMWLSIEGGEVVKTVRIAGINEQLDIETCFGSLVPVNFGLV